MKTIIITFDGEDVQITTEGFSGKACKAATAELERELGTVTSDRTTAEYHKVSHDEKQA